MRIKNWDRFQHFKDRKPIWVKLYRDLLDDIEWHRLDPVAAKALVSLWLIASEDGGNLPSVDVLAFRLRCSEKQVESIVSNLSHWLEQGDIKPISTPGQDDALEKRREREEKEKIRSALRASFVSFWTAWPKKVAKAEAEKAWTKLAPDPLTEVAILSAVRAQSQSDDWRREGGKFIPHPATWINGRRWEDATGPVVPVAVVPRPSTCSMCTATATERIDGAGYCPEHGKFQRLMAEKRARAA